MLLLFISTFLLNSIAQEKIQFSLLGGYEQINNDDIASNNGFGTGAEIKYSFYKKIYAVVNFHMGICKDTKPRTAFSENGEVDFSMKWKTNEYKTGIGFGINILEYDKNELYLQATYGFSRMKYSYPIVTEYRPEVIIRNNNYTFFKSATSISMGYNYKICKHFFTGIDYTGWWIINYKFRHTCNIKIGIIF